MKTENTDHSETEDKTPAENTEAETGTHEEPIEENLDWKDRALRAQAEMQNMKRRLEEETETRTRRRMETLLTEIITVTDHMDLAIQAAPKDLKENSEYQAFIMGITAIRKSLDSMLRTQGLDFIEPNAESAFNPEIHEAIPNQEKVNELTLIRRGYRFGSHILRPAQVHLPQENSPESPAQES